MSERGKTSAGGRIILLLFLVMLAGAAIYLFNFSLKNRKIDLEKALAYIKSEYSFAEISVLSKTGNSFLYNLKLINIGGTAVTDETFTLDGRDIFLECKVVAARSGSFSNAFVFPFNLYTDTIPPGSGKSVTNLYYINGFPSIFTLANMDISYKNTVSFLFENAMEASGNETNIMVRDSKVRIMDVSLHPGFSRRIEEGMIFRCSVHPGGGLELTEVN